MQILYTVEQVAEKFEVHPETVRRLARDGTLTGKKIGSSWRFSDKDLEEFLNKSEVTNQN
jgi:excisionase family DNA binding protein